MPIRQERVAAPGGVQMRATTGSGFVLDLGAYLDSSGSINLDGTAGDGSLNVNNGGSINVNGGTIELAVSTGMQLAAGAFLKVGGTSGGPYGEIEWQAYSKAVFDANSSLTAAGSTTFTLAGTNTFSGTNALSGATTQTALFTRSGTSGRTALRTTTLNSDTNLSVDPSQWDYIEIDASGFTADRAWTFTAPPGGICCTVILKADTTSSWTHALTINGGLFSYGTGGGGTWSGSGIIVYDPVMTLWRGANVVGPT